MAKGVTCDKKRKVDLSVTLAVIAAAHQTQKLNTLTVRATASLVVSGHRTKDLQ